MTIRAFRMISTRFSLHNSGIMKGAALTAPLFFEQRTLRRNSLTAVVRIATFAVSRDATATRSRHSGDTTWV